MTKVKEAYEYCIEASAFVMLWSAVVLSAGWTAGTLYQIKEAVTKPDPGSYITLSEDDMSPKPVTPLNGEMVVEKRS